MLIDLHIFIDSLNIVLEAKDSFTAGHSDRVADLAQQLAISMNYSKDFCENIHIAGHLHDIGKVGIPDGILLKTSKLTCAEFEVIKAHGNIGYEILKNNKGLGDIPLWVKHHHERFDGKGYPNGLKGEEIPEGSRIIALVDALDAMLSGRPYRKQISFAEVIEEIVRCQKTQFDCKMVKGFLNSLFDIKMKNLIKSRFGVNDNDFELVYKLIKEKYK